MTASRSSQGEHGRASRSKDALVELDGNQSQRIDGHRRRSRTSPGQDLTLEAKSDESIQEAMDQVKSLAERISTRSFLSSQAALQFNLLDRSTKRRRRSTHQPGSSSATQGSSSSSSSSTGDGVALEQDILDPAWDTFKAWPQGLEEEEKAIGDYFRRLKMIQLEQETRSIFIHDTNDDTQTVYTASDVRQLEAEVRELKTQLQARKLKARQLRKEIGELAEGFGAFDALQGDVKEANELATRIKDTALELARLKAVRGITAAVEEGEQGTTAPAMGTFTRDEADGILNRQLLAMESLESSQTQTLRAIEAAKRQLTSSSQALDKLNAERSAAEKAAREVKAGTEKQRDHKLEAICRGYSATIKLFHGILGIVSIDAPSETCLRGVYTVCAAKARTFCEEVAIEIHFASIGGRIAGYELKSRSGRQLTDLVAPPGSLARNQLDRAVQGNDASLLLQEALLYIESTTPSE